MSMDDGECDAEARRRIAALAIDHANHSPAVADQIMLVAILKRVNGAVAELAKTSQRAEHVAASGHLRSALGYERTVLDGMKRLVRS